MTKLEHLLKADRKYLWHPYTSAISPLPTYLVESAKGVRITLSDGQELIDGMASWWCVIHGYNHPELNAAAHSQIEKMSHVMFGGLTHEPAIELAKELNAITPSNLQHIFLADSGSIAVEVGMKMAIQYWQAQGSPNKRKMLSLKGGYHGDTFAAMSVCDPTTGMHQIFSDNVVKQFFTDRPSCRFDQDFDASSLKNLESSFEKHHQELAAITLEPIVQGAGGMWFYHPSYLRRVRELCNEYNVLMIADEIATGFGRTGKLLACHWANIEPDILCLGKALTGGYLSLAATLTTRDIAYGISENGGVFMHGPTFMGNPLACSVALASLRLLSRSNWQQSIGNIEAIMRASLVDSQNLKCVRDMRVLGGIGVIEMEDDIDVAESQRFFIEKGVWVRPFGRLLYIMPPYVIGDEDLSKLCEALVDFAKKTEMKSK
ncbi:MAG: adenosylmethionine--8-amino-7-oxononanoate transaminase [Gammaproteobacteria bacterium]|nr:adenosylmethionine--8-amino-7-oxononanoate transaminase [Gammaproteobacteria bacterium]